MILKLMFFGTLNIYKALYSKIKENGSIITINSILAFMNLPIMAQYCASKKSAFTFNYTR